MPKAPTPKSQTRPDDAIVMRIAAGKESEGYGADDGKDKAAQSLGRRGGMARAKALSQALYMYRDTFGKKAEPNM
jgi:hypothetical protein